MKYLLIAAIKLYQKTLSRLLPPCCRFYPSCSRYAVTALGRFGAVKGGYLAIRRIARCNPFSAGGSDPVPARFSFTVRQSESTPAPKE
ncbi:MAG: membrane protein insertion efficiency factor YidD [Ruminiclostridium sp.]|nr:membrane protein insertion efficiency factor YidD [Ruminiclostridium sp.]